MRALGLITVIITGALLLYAAGDLPSWGWAGSPANAGPVSVHYLTRVLEETRVPNVVTAVLADYRGYDTLFETVVVLTAGLSIIAILRALQPTSSDTPTRQEPGDPIVMFTCRQLTPVMQLFALYVLFHGHHSPGGGFQGGVILGASFILAGLARDIPFALRSLPEKTFLLMAGTGVLIFVSFGVAPLFFGENLFDYAALDSLLPGDPIDARYHSILGVEIGVFLTVSAIMFAIYANLATRGSLAKGF